MNSSFFVFTILIIYRIPILPYLVNTFSIASEISPTVQRARAAATAASSRFPLPEEYCNCAVSVISNVTTNEYCNKKYNNTVKYSSKDSLFELDKGTIRYQVDFILS